MTPQAFSFKTHRVEIKASYPILKSVIIRIAMFSATTDLSSCCSIGDDLGVDFDTCSSNGVNLDTFSGLATVNWNKNSIYFLLHCEYPLCLFWHVFRRKCLTLHCQLQYFRAIVSLGENSQTRPLDQLTKNQSNNWPTDKVIRLTDQVLMSPPFETAELGLHYWVTASQNPVEIPQIINWCKRTSGWSWPS